jgi:hypothetical protein
MQLRWLRSSERGSLSRSSAWIVPPAERSLNSDSPIERLKAEGAARVSRVLTNTATPNELLRLRDELLRLNSLELQSSLGRHGRAAREAGKSQTTAAFLRQLPGPISSQRPSRVIQGGAGDRMRRPRGQNRAVFCQKAASGAVRRIFSVLPPLAVPWRKQQSDPARRRRFPAVNSPRGLQSASHPLGGIAAWIPAAPVLETSRSTGLARQRLPKCRQGLIGARPRLVELVEMDLERHCTNRLETKRALRRGGRTRNAGSRRRLARPQ